jgi:hypothetical protein
MALGNTKRRYDKALHRTRKTGAPVSFVAGRNEEATKIVNWCGHSQDFVAWPEADGYWLLVPGVGAVERCHALYLTKFRERRTKASDAPKILVRAA